MFKGFKSFEFKISIFAIMKNFYAPLLFALLMAACTEEDDALSTTVANIPSFYGVAPSSSPISTDALFFKDISYGTNERNRLDLFLPNKGPIEGIVILFHGGSFQFGSKEDFYGEELNNILTTVLDNKIGIANAEYSFITEPHSSGVFTSLTDGSQVINFIRENSTALDLPKNKLILAGVSAGAGIALWNGFREETNSEVKGIVGLYAQSTYDINKWEAIFPDFNLDSIKEVNSEIRDLYTQFYGGEYTAEKAMDLDFLSEIDADDPTLYLYNPVYKDEVISEGILDLDVLFHSFKHADLLRKKTTEVGLECSGAYQELPQEFIERILIDQ